MPQQEKAGWSVRALAHLLGIPGSTASYWVNSGLVTAERRGRGRAGHTIGLQGLREMVAVMELRGAGISLQAVQRAVEELRRLTSEDRPLSQLIVVATGDDVVWHEGETPERWLALIVSRGSASSLCPWARPRPSCSDD